MDKTQVFRLIIWIIFNPISQISAEILSTLYSKDSLLANIITNKNSYSDEILLERNKRDVNDDKIFVEINRLNDKIDELSNQLEQVEENRKKELLILNEYDRNVQNKVRSIEEKITVNLQLSFHQTTEMVSRIEQNEREIEKLGGFESNTNRIEQSFLNLTKELSTEIKKIKEENSDRFVEIEGQIREIQQLVSQQSTQNVNATQESAFISTNNIGRTVNQSETESLKIDEKTWSNRIRDGPSQCRVWPHGEIPFEIGSSIIDHTRRFIDEAMEDFHKKTCIRWIPRQSEEAFVYFVKDTDTQINKTEECYTGGRRIAIVGEEFNKTDVLRQMVYILGLGDEHLRQDRDEYIKLRRDNCTMEEKYPHLNGGGFYDYQSITHPECGRRGDCLQHVRFGPYMYCGLLARLSDLDSNKLNEMYNCKGCLSLRFQFLNQISFNESTLVPIFENAHENRKHICRVQHDAYVLVGRGNVKTGECHYKHGSAQVVSENAQFLTNPQQTKIQWMSRGREFPESAIPGGFNYKGDPVYIARCAEEPQWGESVLPVHIDKYVSSMLMFKGNNSYNTCSSFDILSCP